MTGELLLEIGTEEIPSDYLENGLRDLKRLVESHLRDERIVVGEGLEVYGTPRRLVLVGRAVADKQEDMVQEVTGPPKRAAFDGEGNPTKAAIGFAEKQGVSVDAFKFVETPRGEYVSIKQEIPGRPTIHVLSEVIPGLVKSVPWPKSMRWGDVGFSFVRPIHWVLALLNGPVDLAEDLLAAIGHVDVLHLHQGARIGPFWSERTILQMQRTLCGSIEVNDPAR